MTNASAAAFSALGDPTRRLIFERIAVAKRPASVGRLAAGLSVSRPAVSQHLKVLRSAGLVTHEREGTRRMYRIDHRGIEAMRAYLDRFWDRALAGFKAAAEAVEQEESKRDS
jgi:DNA-binding transcriptional ArsR family regulator